MVALPRKLHINQDTSEYSTKGQLSGNHCRRQLAGLEKILLFQMQEVQIQIPKQPYAASGEVEFVYFPFAEGPQLSGRVHAWHVEGPMPLASSVKGSQGERDMKDHRPKRDPGDPLPV